MTRPIKTLLIDLDQTLLASNKLGVKTDFIRHAFLLLLRSNSIHSSITVMRQVTKALYEDHSPLTNRERVIQHISRVLKVDQNEAERLIVTTIDTLFPKLEKWFHPVPGAHDFLDWATGQFGPQNLILATNPVWTEAVVSMRLRWGSFDPNRFRCITHSGRMHSCKPHVSYYEEILQQENLTAKDCLMIGDDRKKDLPAVKAGIRTFILDFKLPAMKQESEVFYGNFNHLRKLINHANQN